MQKNQLLGHKEFQKFNFVGKLYYTVSTIVECYIKGKDEICTLIIKCGKKHQRKISNFKGHHGYTLTTGIYPDTFLTIGMHLDIPLTTGLYVKYILVGFFDLRC